MILVGSGQNRLAQFAASARRTYSVVQDNSRAVIVEHHRLGLTGYVLPQTEAEIEKGLIARVTAPCLVMTSRQQEDRLTMSVCNPDLGWESGVQFDSWDKEHFRPPANPVPMPVTLTLRGKWTLADDHAEANVLPTDGETTTITVAASDARSIEFTFRKTP